MASSRKRRNSSEGSSGRATKGARKQTITEDPSMSMTLRQLQNECVKRDLDKIGTKKQLLARINTFELSQSAPSTKIDLSSNERAKRTSEESEISPKTLGRPQNLTGREFATTRIAEDSCWNGMKGSRATFGGLRPATTSAFDRLAAFPVTQSPFRNPTRLLSFDAYTTIVQLGCCRGEELAANCEFYGLSCEGGRWEIVGRLTDMFESQQSQGDEFCAAESEEDNQAEETDESDGSVFPSDNVTEDVSNSRSESNVELDISLDSTLDWLNTESETAAVKLVGSEENHGTVSSDEDILAETSIPDVDSDSHDTTARAERHSFVRNETGHRGEGGEVDLRVVEDGDEDDGLFEERLDSLE